MPRDLHPLSAAPPSHDLASDMVASVLADIEYRLGEQQGWDLPPRLFMLRLRPPRVEVPIVRSGAAALLLRTLGDEPTWCFFGWSTRGE
ncbi:MULTISPECIES: hypothetical protein [unclassified Streptomyces]|uniref:hypothetical protein n=1 Tax=unclassified Streptomyces TaxID=2593676 RepID=UPI0036EB8292